MLIFFSKGTQIGHLCSNSECLLDVFECAPELNNEMKGCHYDILLEEERVVLNCPHRAYGVLCFPPPAGKHLRIVRVPSYFGFFFFSTFFLFWVFRFFPLFLIVLQSVSDFHYFRMVWSMSSAPSLSPFASSPLRSRNILVSKIM